MLIHRSRENLETKHYCHFIQGDPGGVLIVEFYGETKEEAIANATLLSDSLQQQKIAYAWPVISERQAMEEVLLYAKRTWTLMG